MTTNDVTVGDLEQPGVAVHRFALPPLGWLFVAMAVAYAWLVVERLHLDIGLVPGLTVSGDTSAPIALLLAVGSVATVLLPAAILYRAPSATRDHPLLLSGTAIVAAWTLATAAFGWWASRAVDVAQLEFVSMLARIAWLVSTVGILLVAVGMARIRDGRFGARAIAVTLLAIILVLVPSALSYVRFGTSGANVGLVGLDLLATTAIGARLAVPIGAWLDGERPNGFWIPLAAVSVAALGGYLLQSVQVLTIQQNTSFFIDGFGTQAWIVTIGAVVTLIAFARFLPLRANA